MMLRQRVGHEGFAVVIVLVVTVMAILTLATLTKAGVMPNFLNISALETSDSKSSLDNDLPGLNDKYPDDCIEHGELCSVAEKPIIYFYPNTPANVTVSLDYSGKLLHTYPKIDQNNSWNVRAQPDGKIVDNKDGREYSYLFWEGKDRSATYDLNKGFVVPGSETADFLRNKLSIMGLTPKEYNEFIVYWLPKMELNKFNLVHFASKEEYEDRAKLTITPKPDSIKRVFMVFKALDTKTTVEPQNISGFSRYGFTVVEWGGTELSE